MRNWAWRSRRSPVECAGRDNAFIDQGEENACAVLLPFCYHRWQAYLPLFIDGMLSAPYSPAVLSSFASGGLLFPAASFLPPAGDFLPIAAERFTVVSAGFQPRCGMKTGTLPRNRLAASATGGASAVSAMTRQEGTSLVRPLGVLS